MGEDYKVEAQLTVKNTDAVKKANEVARKLRDVQKQFKRTRDKGGDTLNKISSGFSRLSSILGRVRGLFGGTAANLVALGGAYFGVRAIANTFERMATTTVQVNSNVEDMTTSIAALYAQIERVSFDEAQRSATGLFARLNDIAVRSPATATELLNIFRGVYGPLRNAGAGMQDLLRFSQNASAVGASLQIDYEQLSRDVAMMATGVAGTDVKTFRLLRSMGLITESTKEWNELAQRDSTAAMRKLLNVFERLGGPAADAFGRTWTGISSTFRGLVEQFMRVFSSPMFNRLKEELRRVNDFLLRYRSNIESVLRYVGDQIAYKFSDIMSRARRGFRRIISDMDTIVRRIDQAIEKFNQFRPLLTKIGKVMLVLHAVAAIFGPLFSMLNVVMSAMSVFGGGGAAAGGAAAGGGAALGAALGPLLLVIGIVVAAFMSIITVVRVLTMRFTTYEQWATTSFATIRSVITIAARKLWDELGALWTEIQALASDMWDFLEPIFLGIGTVIVTGVISIFRLLVGVIRVVVGIARIFGHVLGWLGRNVLTPALRGFVTMVSFLQNMLGDLGGVIGELVAWIGGLFGDGETRPPAQRRETEGQPGMFEGIWEELQGLWNRPPPTPEGVPEGPGRTPPDRPGNNIDMRGSRIEVNQEFREADPDRVWIQMRDALEREATQRITSGFVPALSR